MPTSVTLHAFEAALHLLDDLINGETRRPLAWRILLEGCEELSNKRLSGINNGRGVSYDPIVVTVRGDVGALIGVRPQIEYLGKRSFVKGSAQMRRVPGARCSSNTIFQFS